MAEDKIRHLAAVLKAVRNINRLVLQEHTVEGLIQKACEKLVGSRSYYNAWIVLLEDASRIRASAEAGLGTAFSGILQRFEQARPVDCWEKTRHSAKPVVVADPLTSCGRCPVSRMYNGRGAFSARLKHGKKCFGILTVSIPTGFLADKEEHRLFSDAAGEIAFGLRGIEIEQERRKSEQALIKARDELELRVKQRTRELETLSSMLLNIQEDERKRIAADLHDGIGQSLSAIKFTVETVLEQIGDAADLPAATSMRALLPMLSRASEDVREIVMNLRPAILDDLGVIATIHWFCRQFTEIYSTIHIQKYIDIKENQIPLQLKTIIYRVLQEAMNNIAKHSGADAIEILLSRSRNRIELCVSDNGCGFDLKDRACLEALRNGFGITGMKERTELSRGTFEIQSGTGTGTRIKAAWPLTG